MRLTSYGPYSQHLHEINPGSHVNHQNPQNIPIYHADLFIPPSNTRNAVLTGNHSSRPQRFSISPLTFHLAHTTKESDVGSLQRHCLESIFYHHPNAKVIMHVKNMTAAPFQYLIDAEYDITVQKYNVNDLLHRLENAKVVPAEMIHQFSDRIPTHMAGKNWYTSETNILRLVMLHLEGGIYLGKCMQQRITPTGSSFVSSNTNIYSTWAASADTDMIVVKPLDTLPSNTIGYQDNGKMLNGAFLKFQPRGSFLQACMEEILTDYRDSPWGYNGPALLTRVYKSKNPPDWEVNVVNRRAFQYFRYPRVLHQCYLDDQDEKVQERLNGIREFAYAVHLNNRFTYNKTAQAGTTCDCIFRTFCLSSLDCGSAQRCQLLFENGNNRTNS
jgi:Alpha 1,4-glycosyltransferase conserved region